MLVYACKQFSLTNSADAFADAKKLFALTWINPIEHKGTYWHFHLLVTLQKYKSEHGMINFLMTSFEVK